MFLNLLRQEGATVIGIEPNAERRAYARRKYGIELRRETLGEPFWSTGHEGEFDVVSLWDVIEHVNLPVETLETAANLTKAGGLLCLDTPARDGFYYRVGQTSYALTRGASPLFLNVLYSNAPFGHKQIFSITELANLVQRLGYRVLSLKLIHELSFPYEFYLRRLFGSAKVAAGLSPLVQLFFFLVRIRNKMVLVAQKSPG
jgi:2-polyprenyl-3-methyl-5-hydroxy-6-metoxy-1,4-benzoquinol methylase